MSVESRAGDYFSLTAAWSVASLRNIMPRRILLRNIMPLKVAVARHQVCRTHANRRVERTVGGVVCSRTFVEIECSCVR